MPPSYYFAVFFAFVFELLAPAVVDFAAITAGEGSLSSSITPPPQE